MRWIVAASCALALGAQAPAEEQTAWLELAAEAARWIDAHTIETVHGVTWPADPEDQGMVSGALYAGSPGVVLFFLELHEATGDAHWRERAIDGADHLVAMIDDDDASAGLYSGLGGVAFTLARTADATSEARFDDAARSAIARMRLMATDVGDGASWGAVTDIISGDAGAGLALLWAHDRWGDARDLSLARRVGRHLLAVARATDAGLSWSMAPDYPRLMPNFSHGTAGVAYFLARLHEAGGDEAFLDGAIAGAEHLLAIADGGLIHHHTPGGEDLHYLGWCHGPTGTSRLFEQLHNATGEARWRDAAVAGGAAILETGAPGRRSAGYWENVGVCCGSSGIASFLLDTWRATGDDAWLGGAMPFGADVRQRASRVGGHAKWIQAEHRVRPEFLVAQTGYMQGAAGVGLLLLRLDAIERGRAWTLRLPDDPHSVNGR